MRLRVNVLGWGKKGNSADLSWAHSFPCSCLSIDTIVPGLPKMALPAHLAVDVGSFCLGGSHVYSSW